MDTSYIAELLEPFLSSSAHAPVAVGATAPAGKLTPVQLERISIYIDLLLRWNARINLTAIRDPEEIVTRHFGESLFAARHLFPGGADAPGSAVTLPSPDTGRLPYAAARETSDGRSTTQTSETPARQATGDAASGRLLDLGSGAGFPGLPVKIWSPKIPVTLIESSQKKVAFLREVIRALTLTAIDVFPQRGEAYPGASASVVALRAVERFEDVLPTSARLVAPGGSLALLIGRSQTATAQQLPAITWETPLLIPNSQSRVLLIGHAPGTIRKISGNQER